ncbi:MAG TPA: hypothetical protein VMG98_02320 [Verrucomicrobiae bacterium]|nr:hypothetical protein [Verrucomicrobiae bacterium]
MIAFLLAALLYPGHVVTYTGDKPMQAYLVETPAAGGALHLDAWEVDHGKTLQHYDIDMTKVLHMIVVSDDLTDFQHIHPVLHANGHFTIDLYAKERGLYHVYIDGIPHDLGRTVFRFDIPVGSATPARTRRINPAGSTQRAGPYTVTLDPVSVPFGEIATISVSITKDGKLADDLHPYLGMTSHGVFIGTRDLAYMHGHGMTEQMLDATSEDCGDSLMQSMTPMPPGEPFTGDFAFEILAPNAQQYDFWMQFIGGGTLYTVPFLVTAR